MLLRCGLRLLRKRAIFDVLLERPLSIESPSCSTPPSISHQWLAEIKNAPDTPIVYTDGACKFNGKAGAVGGIGVYWGPDNPHNVAAALSGIQTNNRAELQAVATALTQAISLKYDRIILRSDSKFLISSLSKWSLTWRQNGWKTVKGEEVKNRQDFEQILELMDKIQVEFEYIEGHSNESGNDEADRLANEGVQKRRVIPVVYIGGVSMKNGQGEIVGGIGVYWGPKDPSNVSEPLTGAQNKERAKIQAVNTALNTAISLAYNQLIVRTDSEFLISSLRSLYKWKSSGWKKNDGGEISNREDFESVADLMAKIQVELEHIPMNHKIWGKEQAEAERLAKKGARRAKRSDESE